MIPLLQPCCLHCAQVLTVSPPSSSFLLPSSQGHNSSVGSLESIDDQYRRDDIRYNIMGFIAETLRTYVDMRYQVLEMFNRCEITESTSLRASWMQQMLATVQEKLYMCALQEYM